MEHKFREYFLMVLYKFLKFLVTYTPNFVQDTFFSIVAWSFYKFDKKHTNIMRTNLNLCYENTISYEEKEVIIRATYRNYAYFVADFFKNQETTKQKALEKVRFKNEEILSDTLKLNRPIIVQTAHYGNWELFSLAMAAKLGSIAIVGRNLDSKFMDKILSKNRTQFDIELIPKNGAAKGVIKAIRNGRSVGILADQNTAKKEGVEVEFFGKKVMHTPAVSIFADKLNAVIIPAFIKRADRNINEICFFDPIFIENFDQKERIIKATQAQSDATEAMIRQKPDEYFWMHKRFKHFYEDSYEKT